MDDDNPKTELALAGDEAARVRISSSGPREIEARGKSRREEEGRPRVTGVNGRILHLVDSLYTYRG